MKNEERNIIYMDNNLQSNRTAFIDGQRIGISYTTNMMINRIYKYWNKCKVGILNDKFKEVK